MYFNSAGSSACFSSSGIVLRVSKRDGVQWSGGESHARRTVVIFTCQRRGKAEATDREC